MNVLDQARFNLLLVASIVITIIKLIVVSRNEIVAIPHDPAVYVHQALAALGELGSPVGYPLWLWLVKHTGVPQRVAIELLYCLACSCLVLILCKRIGLLLSLLVLVALALNPATYYLFDQALSDPLYLCLTLFAICLSILLLDHPGQDASVQYVSAGGLGAVLGGMAVTRNEIPLTLAWSLWLALLMFLWQSRANTRMVAAKGGLKTLLTIGIVFYIVSSIPKLYHYTTKGVWASAIATMPSHIGLLSRLAAIDTGEEDARYVAVSKKARYLAYRVSPTLSRLRPFIERNDNVYIRASHDIGGVPEGEVGSGWVWHVFNDAALKAIESEKTTPELATPELDALWTQVIKEVDAAFDSGVLRKRFVIHPLLGAGFVRPLSTFPQGLSAVFEKSFRFMPRQSDLGYNSKSFDEVCNRRASLVVEVVKVQGWGFVDRKVGKLLGVQFGYTQAAGGGTGWIDLTPTSRPDVNDAFAKALGRQVEAFGFKGEMIVPQGTQVFLRYSMPGDVVLDKALLANKVERSLLSSGGAELYRGLDYFERASALKGGRQFEALLSGVIEWNGWQIVKLLSAFILIAPFLLMLGFRSLPTFKSSIPYFIGLLVAGLAFQRLAFYALINENAWDAEPRYVSSVFCMLLIVMFCVIAFVIPRVTAPSQLARGRNLTMGRGL